MASVGYGIGAYGRGGYGVTGASISLDYAFPLSVRSVRVVLSEEAKAESPTRSGDALNPATWFVTRVDTGASFPVIGVSQSSRLAFDIFVLGSFASRHTTHRVRSDTLRSVSGSLLADPRAAEFLGLISEALSTVEKSAVEKRQAIRDLANPPVPNSDDVSGTLQIAESGDYVSVEGVELVRKLVMRRLTTMRGDFFHLPDYGMFPSAKNIYTVYDLIAMKGEMERQILREQGVSAASVSLALLTTGMLNISIRVTVAPTGQTVPLGITIHPATLSL